MIEGIIFMLGLGVVCAVILTAASRIFYVYEDPRIAEVEACFAGANCGGCGYAGCSAAAVAVVAGEADVAHLALLPGLDGRPDAALVVQPFGIHVPIDLVELPEINIFRL